MPSRTHGAVDKLVTWIAVAGGWVLIAVAAAVVVSVTLRSDLLQMSGVPGDFELVQMGTAICAFAFLPLTQLRRGNIFVDTFTLKFSPSVRASIDAIWDTLFGLAMLLIAWRLAVGAMQAFQTGENSMVLRFPLFWPIAICALLALLVSLTCFVTASRLLRSRK